MLVFLDTDKAYHNRLDTILKEDVHPHIQLVHSEECILGIDNYSILIIPFGYDQWNHRLSPLLGGRFFHFLPLHLLQHNHHPSYLCHLRRH